MIRVVVVEHGAGAAGVAVGRALRDAGLEVVHAGPQDHPDRVVTCVVQEDADVLVVVLPAGETTLPERGAEEAAFLEGLGTLLERSGAGDVPVVRTRGASGVVDQVAAALDEQSHARGD